MPTRARTFVTPQFRTPAVTAVLPAATSSQARPYQAPTATAATPMQSIGMAGAPTRARTIPQAPVTTGEVYSGPRTAATAGDGMQSIGSRPLRPGLTATLPGLSEGLYREPVATQAFPEDRVPGMVYQEPPAATVPDSPAGGGPVYREPSSGYEPDGLPGVTYREPPATIPDGPGGGPVYREPDGLPPGSPGDPVPTYREPTQYYPQDPEPMGRTRPPFFGGGGDPSNYPSEDEYPGDRPPHGFGGWGPDYSPGYEWPEEGIPPRREPHIPWYWPPMGAYEYRGTKCLGAVAPPSSAAELMDRLKVLEHQVSKLSMARDANKLRLLSLKKSKIAKKLGAVSESELKASPLVKILLLGALGAAAYMFTKNR